MYYNIYIYIMYVYSICNIVNNITQHNIWFNIYIRGHGSF